MPGALGRLIPTAALIPAGTFALRMVTPELAARVLALEPAALATLGATWVGCMADLFWSAMWVSSGVLGQ